MTTLDRACEAPVRRVGNARAAVTSKRILAAVVPVLLVAGTASAASRIHRDERRSIETSGQRTIVVRNGRGQTVIVGSPNERNVTVVADMYVRAGDDDTARSLMDELTFAVVEGEDEIVVETNRPEPRNKRRGLLSMLRGSSEAYIDYTIEVPRSFGVVSWSTSGDVRVTNVGGDAEIHATSGDVSLREIGGSARVELTSGTIDATSVARDLRILASSGSAVVERVGGGLVMQATSADVEARQVAGDCQVQLITGDFDLDGCLGNVHFQTSTGDAEFRNVEGGINAITASGRLVVMIVPVGDKEFVLSSSSGDIDVSYKMPRDYGFLLDVATGTGSISGDLAIKVEEINRRRLKGIVGTGKSKLIIETASGDVTIAESK